ncbi:MAG TPA: ectonucleotide pyrophosphatase/phosphodiesterase [Rhizomicrobium sp.]|nr:ectonucleotide pyrophosphatase/phosphodiesterase [Rhizomicrobium sp.]
MKNILRLAACLLVAALAVVPASAAERTVIVVLFDGFSPAMMDATQTPNFDRIAKEGAWSRHLVPAFPTLSMTNHNTFSTGCWPEHHGILSNLFYDPKRGLFGHGANFDDADWRTGCETMWEAAERQGVRAAVFNWVGRWSKTRGARATYINPDVPFSLEPSDDEVVAKGIAMLKDNGPNHPRLIALYLRGPDEDAHYNGVTAPQTLAAVRHADAIVGKLMAAIKAMPPGREGTLIVGTDHGMIDVGPLVNIGRLLEKFDIHARQASDGGTAFLYLDKGESADRVAAALAPYSDVFKVYRKGHFPAYAHLGNGPRVPDLMLVTHPPYWMVGPEMFPDWANWLGINYVWPVAFTPFTSGLKATHGFDPNIVQMHGIFYAWGSGVAKGRQIPRLDMIDIHPTVMTLLGLQPGKPVDGKPVAAMLAP